MVTDDVIRDGFAEVVQVEPENTLTLIEHLAGPGQVDSVPARCGDGLMEIMIEADHRQRIAATRCRSVLALQLLYSAQLRGFSIQRCQSSREAIHQFDGVEVARDRGDVERRNNGTTIAQRVHQAFGREADQRLANR